MAAALVYLVILSVVGRIVGISGVPLVCSFCGSKKI
jgi:hypothetical protein